MNAVEPWKEHCKNTPYLLYDGDEHDSFDYAQQVHYPFNEQQPGPVYFLTARKCQNFGVFNDGQSKQVNYLIDVANVTGKGANSTISYIHYYLENYRLEKGTSSFIVIIV